MNIQNKIVIVTGASKGIGEAAARLLAERGAKVVLAARSQDRLAVLEREMPGSYGVTHQISDGFAIVVPAGTRHNIVNTSATDAMKLYTLYSPPDHKDGIVHVTKADAMANDLPFDGKTTE